MDFHFLVMEKSWKINVEKGGTMHCGLLLYCFTNSGVVAEGVYCFYF